MRLLTLTFLCILFFTCNKILSTDQSKTFHPCTTDFQIRSVKKGSVNYINLIPTNKKVSTIPIQFNQDDPSHFSDGLAAVRIGTKWGYIDKIGNVSIQPTFDLAVSFSEGFAAVRVGDQWGY
ncbi:WG repeat-containing protein [Leptospira noguchii]|nr:WG repeat-containing protein [Leptospira noguchii]EMO90076.1 hypothetical protein LEP1GSC024_2897 [Leptospira noguchii str. 2001034031]